MNLKEQRERAMSVIDNSNCMSVEAAKLAVGVPVLNAVILDREQELDLLYSIELTYRCLTNHVNGLFTAYGVTIDELRERHDRQRKELDHVFPT